MKGRVFGLLALLAAQSGFALEQCPPEAKQCGPNPFYILVAGLARTCAAQDPEHAREYRAQLDKFVAENPKVYAELDSDVQFSKELIGLEQKLNAMRQKELRKECTKLRTESKTQAPTVQE